MIKERYVSFEVAKLLEEKGFKQDCFAKYAKETCTERYYNDYREKMMSWIKNPGDLIIPDINHENYEIYGETIPAPTQQMAMDWLQEVYNICIVIEPLKYDYINQKNVSYIITLWQGDNYYQNITRKDYPTYEEAVNEAFKYAHENLI